MRELLFLIMISFVFLLVLPSTYSNIAQSNNVKFDFTLKPSMSSVGNNSEIHTVLNPTARNDTKGHLFHRIVEIIEGAAGGGKKVEAKKVVTVYYDVILILDKLRYKPGEIVGATIIIINKGDDPDRDAILTYYLLDKHNRTYGHSEELFKEVPPTCPNAEYDDFQDVCMHPNGSTSEPLKSEFHRRIALPPDSTVGEWRWYVEYETEIQELVSVHQTFRVDKHSIFALIALIILIVIVISSYRNKERWKRKI
ncbi:unnamed protein product [marine sediment metagenome]|uniref:DUF11 domain-containing protein n=1 Tax=marine sediment metagenome TaxID=412755 RepID=X0S3U5_9ZZZZ